MNDEVKKFLQENGRKGGLKRKKLYSKAQLSAWGKSGGRPKKLSPYLIDKANG